MPFFSFMNNIKEKKMKEIIVLVLGFGFLLSITSSKVDVEENFLGFPEVNEEVNFAPPLGGEPSTTVAGATR